MALNRREMVSVCMAVCNGEKYIREQIESVLSELQEGDELLIFDDFSRDSTVKIATEFELDERVTIYESQSKLGVVKNFERALYEAKGDYIFLCDQDDVWLPRKVEQCLQFLNDSILVVSDCTVVDAQLSEMHASFFKLRYSGAGLFHNILRNGYLGCCMAFRKDLLKYALPIPANVPMHDMWLGLVAETRGHVFFLPQSLILYRRHGANLSSTAEKSKFSFCKKIGIRARIIHLLFVRLIRNSFIN